MKAEFSKTVDILVKAYLNDTLKHGSCYACAVGNIIANGLGCSVVESSEGKGLKWSNDMPYPAWNGRHIQGWGAAFATDNSSDYDSKVCEYDLDRVTDNEALTYPIVQKQIKASGYDWQELSEIEFAFESAPKGKNSDEWMFNGLMKVVEVLADIHGISLEAKEEAKKMFVKTEAI